MGTKLVHVPVKIGAGTAIVTLDTTSGNLTVTPSGGNANLAAKVGVGADPTAVTGGVLVVNADLAVEGSTGLMLFNPGVGWARVLIGPAGSGPGGSGKALYVA